MAKRRKNQRNGTGVGVDAFGGAVVDPTANVIALSRASSQRQDDLRNAERRYVDSEIARVREASELKAGHVKEITVIHQTHDYALHKAEQGRLDALRANDREDVKALAVQTIAKADAIQKQVEASAKALADSFAAAMAEQNKERRQNKEDTDKRLSALELAQSEGRGKATVESPMMAEMVAEIKSQRLEQAEFAKTLAAALSNTAGRQALSTPLLMTIAAIVAGLLVFLIEKAIKG